MVINISLNIHNTQTPRAFITYAEPALRFYNDTSVINGVIRAYRHNTEQCKIALRH